MSKKLQTIVLGVVAVLAAAWTFISGEGLLIAIIAAFEVAMGFWAGMLAFALACLVTTTCICQLADRLSRGVDNESFLGRLPGWLRKAVKRTVTAGSLASAFMLGPLVTPIVYSLLGWHGKKLLTRSLVAAVCFSLLWYTLYGGGAKIIGELLRRPS